MHRDRISLCHNHISANILNTFNFLIIITTYHEKSAVFSRIPNTLRITFRYSACHISASPALHNPQQPYWQIAVINKTTELDNEKA